MKVFVSMMLLGLVACATPKGEASLSSRIGVGAAGFASLSKKMIVDMQTFFSKQLVFSASEDCAVRVILDSQKIDNESAERFNFQLLVDAFVARLNDDGAAKKLSLVGRRLSFIDKNRALLAGKETRRSCFQAGKQGADYLLMGRVATEDRIDDGDVRQRQTLISFWLLDLETSAKAWSSQPYLFKSVGQNDVIYR
jgi:hypothetical protein